MADVIWDTKITLYQNPAGLSDTAATRGSTLNFDGILACSRDAS